MKIKLLVTSILFFSFISLSYSQSLLVSTDTNNVMIGDLVELNIQYLSPKKTDISLPLFDISEIKGLEILNESKLDSIKNGNAFGLSKRYTVSAYDSGSFVIPRISLLVDNNGVIDTLFSDSVILRFNSPAIDTAQAIKDIKGIYNVDYSDYSWLYLILIVIAIILISYFAYRYYKKRKDRNPQEEIDYDPNIPPYVLALESLRRVEQERLWQNGNFKKYYSEITDILRVYYHRIYDIKTKELTSHELSEALIGQKLFDTESKQKLDYISQYSDLSKFAKANPLSENNTQSLNYAFDLVEAGKPLSDNHAGGTNV